jgi:co-chaperonin GroES (HSP10)
MYRRSGTGYVLVACNATHSADSGKKGLNGLPIMIDIIFDPIQYVFNHANVINTPVDMGGKTSPISQKSVGHPGYGPLRKPAASDDHPSFDLYAIGGVYNYKFVSDIHPEVEIGDKIYFKKRTLNSPKNQMGILKDASGKPVKYIYKVPYENIFCTVKKDGTIIPIGGWTLLRPITQDWVDIFKKTYYPYTDKLGGKIERPQSEWIKLKAAPECENQRAVVAHIGKPLKGDVCDIEEGMTVVFRKMQKVFLHKIEGVDYIVLAQDQILCQLIDNVKVS